MHIKRDFVTAVTGILCGALPWLAYAHGISEADRQAVLEGGNLTYMQLGATHMLTGYDHLLFVFGIIFFLRSFRDIVKYVTAFTLGHSVTLILATFYAVQVNYFLIDAVIALSVCYIAFANIDGFRKYLDVKAPNMMAMIVGLGLVHGLGLSSRLQEFPLSEDGLLLNIVSFNVGIELGQILALLIMILIMDSWRKTRSFGKFTLASNYVLILAGGLLFLMQMHGYAHYSAPADFTAAAAPGGDVPQPATAADDLSSPGLEGPWEDTITVRVPPWNSREYKFQAPEGATFEYAWSTGGQALYYDFHGEPEGDATGYFESYEENTAAQSSGSLTAPFTGIHGWYWQNDTSTPVEVTLKARGNYARLDQPTVPSVTVPPTQVPILADQGLSQEPSAGEVITVTIPAQSSREYKFRLEEGASFEYAWEAGGKPLFYDFHGEPAGDTSGFFESYEKDTAARAGGSFTAPFTGIHGWYWKNESTAPVQVILRAEGDYQRTDGD